MKILIADDDRIPLEALRSLLVKWGHEVVACSDGTEAWEILRRDGAPKFAILDWVMPGMEGIEICRKVRELSQREQTYILLLTGRGSQEDIVAGLEAGADDYIVKPFVRDELWARVRVGVRFVELQDRFLTAERARVLAETAGAVAHRINQPLTIIIGATDILLLRALDEFQSKYVTSIQKAGEEISQIVTQMQAARQYATTHYVMGSHIIDFDAAAEEDVRGDDEEKSG